MADWKWNSSKADRYFMHGDKIVSLKNVISIEPFSGCDSGRFPNSPYVKIRYYRGDEVLISVDTHQDGIDLIQSMWSAITWVKP